MYQPQQHMSLNKRIPMALLFTIVLQVGAVVWWASMTQAQDHFRDMRLDVLEMRRNADGDRLEHILERLSRLEARSDAMLDIMQRVDLQLNHKK
ncbi:MAG: hypothetical protein K2Q32_09565 [Alphaproteobacteria bacterium]|nr:hypothetical protein [Alphaproteobacteria bacterium]